MPRLPLATLILAPILTSLGCGPPPVIGKDEMHKLRYALHTDTRSDASLDEVVILTQSEQRIDAKRTWPARWFKHANNLYVHTLDDDCDAEWSSEKSDGDLPWLVATVHSPGSCTLQTYHDDELYDRIVLHFDDVDELDFSLEMDDPDGAGFEEVHSPPSTVPVDTRIKLHPVPLAADGSVLVGRYNIDLDVDTPPDSDLGSIEEALAVIYRLDVPGDFTFHFTDRPTGVSTSVQFTVVE